MEILEKILNDEKAYDMINRLHQNELEMKNAALQKMETIKF